MPTGYTADVATGVITELTPFVMQLARGMGALVTMRDDPADAPIPDQFSASPYYADRLSSLIADRASILALTEEGAQAEADRILGEDRTAAANYIAEKTAQRDRYLAMIAKVEAWTGQPEGIKEFALQQLRESLRFDCGDEPFEYYKPLTEQSGAEWKSERLAVLDRDIEYATKADADETARVAGRNAWLAQLRASLAGAS